MLTDEQVLPVANYWAKRLSGSKVEENELLSIAYITGKPLKDPRLLQKWIKFTLLKFTLIKFLTSHNRKIPDDYKLFENYSPNLDNVIDVNSILSSLNLSLIDSQIVYNRFWLGKKYIHIASVVGKDVIYVRRRMKKILSDIKSVIGE